MRVQALIIGGGLAGSSVYRELVSRNINCALIDSPTLSSASRIASGILNPMVVRSLLPQEHLVKAADLLGTEPLAMLKDFYGTHYRGAEFAHVLNSAEESEAWERARTSVGTGKYSTQAGDFGHQADHGSPRSFLGEPRSGPLPEPFAAWGFAAGAWAPISGCGLVNMESFLALGNGSLENALAGRVFRDQYYASQPISHHADRVECGEISADFAIFCEGWRVAGNPLWTSLRMKPAKGEILRLRLAGVPGFGKGDSPGTGPAGPLRAKDGKAAILSASCHVVVRDAETRLCDVGASASWDALDEEPDVAARNEILGKFSRVYRGPFVVESQRAGVRPASADRRPIVGTHPHIDRFAIVNGLGGRGLLVAPILAMLLADRLFPKTRKLAAEIPREWDVARFF